MTPSSSITISTT